MAKVLVVDDDPDILALLAFRLRKMGHGVVTAASADEALSLVSDKGAPDVAVLDVMMPGCSGLDLLTRMRQHEGFEAMPAIFLSGRIQSEDIAAGEALGATYLTKPVVINALGQAIDRVLPQSEGGTW